jgi:hypothetical protein
MTSHEAIAGNSLAPDTGRQSATVSSITLDTMEIGSLCALGGGLPLGVKNALQYFRGELDGYFR